MQYNPWLGLRRYDPLLGEDFSITNQQLVAIGEPRRSIREMLAAGEQAESAVRVVGRSTA